MSAIRAARDARRRSAPGRAASRGRCGARGGRRRRCGCGGRCRRAARRRPRRSGRGSWRCRSATSQLGAGLGVDELEQPDVGQLELAGVDDLDGQHLVARRRAPAAAAPTRRGARKSETTTTRPRRRVAAARRRERRRRGRTRPAWSASAREQGTGAAGPAGWSRPARAGRVTAPLALERRRRRRGCRCAAVRKPDGRDGGEGEVALLAVGGAEGEAGRQVDERSRSRARGRRSVSRTWGSCSAGGDVPVDAAHVVARLVGAGSRRARCRARARGRGSRPAAGRRGGG